jgi:hypothetical protein
MTKQLRLHRRKAVAAAAAAAILTMASQAHAQPKPILGGYSLAFDLNIGGNPPPAGTPAWLIAEITDNLSGGVFVDLIGNLQGQFEFFKSVGFNLTKKVTANNGNLPGSLWSCSSSTIGCGYTKIEQQFDNLPKVNFANGAQGFDLAIHLPTSSWQNRFQGNDTARFSISGLSPDDFLDTNDPGSQVTGLWSAAKVQGVGPNGKGSTTIADPPATSEAPGPLPLLGAGVALGFSRRLRQRLHHGAS